MNLKNNNKNKISCISGCLLKIYDKNYSYWENREITSDELEIVYFLKKKKIKNKNILHIGIGNSYFAKNLSKGNSITGVTILEKEFFNGNQLNLNKYKIIIKNKYQKNFCFKKKTFDIIVDINLKSYSCCQEAFDYMFKNLTSSLKKNSIIVTSKKGMNWTSNLTSKVSFKLNNFLKKKIKESKGKISNILSKEECIKLANENKMKLIYPKQTNIVIFKKT